MSYSNQRLLKPTTVFILLVLAALSLPIHSMTCRAESQSEDAAADNTETTTGSKVYTIETIYVTETTPETEGEASKAVSIDTKEKIDAGQVKSVADLLRDAAGFTVQTSANGGTKVTMRGLTGERFLVAVNGNIQENQGGLYKGRGFEWDMIPFENIEKIEIIRGASSAAYPGTWGGVVNIVTKANPQNWLTSFKMSYGDWDTKKYSLFHQGIASNKRLSWNININKDESDGYYRNNWLDDEDVNLGFNYNLANGNQINFAWTHDDKDEGIAVGNGSTSKNGYDSNYPVSPENSGLVDDSYRHWKSENLSLNYLTATTELRLYQYSQYRTEWQRRSTVAALSEAWQSDLTNSGANWQHEIFANENHRLIYGVQYQYLDYDLSSSGSDIKTDQPGLFIQDYWQIQPGLTLGWGARYDYFKIDTDLSGRDPFKDSESRITPKLNLTKKINSKNTVYASVSSVFRPPTASDYSRWSTPYFEDWDSDSASQKVATDLGLSTQAEWQKLMGVLKPEKGWSYELGWRQKLNDSCQWRLTGFYNDINNYIYNYFPDSIVSGYSFMHITYNAGDAIIKGMELSWDYIFNPQLSAVLNITHQKGSKDPDTLDPDTTIDSIPEDTVNLGLRYQLGNFRAAWDTRYSSNISDLGEYTVTDLSAMYTYKKSSFSLAILNLFDQDYEEYEDWPMPGISYSISWQYRF
jgi:outer membrane receptor protein involved in Fe transport